MKKFKVIYALIGLILVLAFVFLLIAERLIEKTSDEEKAEEQAIVGKWTFYKDIDDLVNSNWTIEFKSDGTYESDSSPSPDDRVSKKDIYGYGTYTVGSGTNGRDQLNYYHTEYEKNLSVEFVIETIDDREYLTFYRSTSGPIVAARVGSEKVYETFIRDTEG